MRFVSLVSLCFLGSAFAQSTNDLSSLPSTKPEQKLPALDEPEPQPQLPATETPPSISIPRLRSPEEEQKKTKDEDWAAQGVKEKQEAAKKKQQEELQQAEAKAQQMVQQDQVKSSKKSTDGSPVISKSAAEKTGEADSSRLPAVTGIDGVKPRSSDAGDGRVQPGFDSFTGPSSSSPMGKDYQSGAKPIMPSSSSQDGRMMLPPKPPEPPSGAYKKISEDPNAMPLQKETPKPVQPAKPKVEANNVPAGNPLTPGHPAGFSPYDNSKNVPDPRSTRRF